MGKPKIFSVFDIEINAKERNELIVNDIKKNKERVLNPVDELIKEADLKSKEIIVGKVIDEETSKMESIIQEINENIVNDEEQVIEGYHDELVMIGIKENEPVIIRLSNNFDESDFCYIMPNMFRIMVSDNGENIKIPENIDIFTICKESYNQYLIDQSRMSELTDDELENIISDYEVVDSNESEEYLNLLRKYVGLSHDERTKEGNCRVIKKYHGESKSEIVEVDKYKKSEVQYYGDYTYPCILNKYTNEVLMVDPAFDPISDFNRILHRTFTSKKIIKNPKKNLDDFIRNRKDIRFESLLLSYKENNIAEENVHNIKNIETEDYVDYMLRHIYFNEKYFLSHGELDDRFRELAESLLSQNISDKAHSYIYRMYISSFKQTHNPFGVKYFGVKLADKPKNELISFYAATHDRLLLSRSEFLSPLTSILYNDGEEKAPLKRFKKRNQLLTQKETATYLRELTFESKLDLNQALINTIGEPTVYFERDEIKHWSYQLDSNFINHELLERADKVIENFIIGIVKKSGYDENSISEVKFGSKEMYLNNFNKPYYSNYKLTSNKVDFNRIKRL